MLLVLPALQCVSKITRIPDTVKHCLVEPAGPLFGGPGRILTSDLLLVRQALFNAELRALCVLTFSGDACCFFASRETFVQLCQRCFSRLILAIFSAFLANRA